MKMEIPNRSLYLSASRFCKQQGFRMVVGKTDKMLDTTRTYRLHDTSYEPGRL